MEETARTKSPGRFFMRRWERRTLGRLATLGDLPHLPVGGLDMTAETVRVEEGMGGAVLRQPGFEG